MELAPIRVNCITPGIIDTPAWAELLPDDQRQAQLDNTAAMLPLKRVGKPENVARAATYLMENGFATGCIIDIDGGHRVI